MVRGESRTAEKAHAVQAENHPFPQDFRCKLFPSTDFLLRGSVLMRIDDESITRYQDGCQGRRKFITQ